MKWLLAVLLVLFVVSAFLYSTVSVDRGLLKVRSGVVTEATPPPPATSVTDVPVATAPAATTNVSSSASSRPTSSWSFDPVPVAFGCRCPPPCVSAAGCAQQNRTSSTIRIAIVGDSHMIGFQARNLQHNQLFIEFLTGKILRGLRNLATSASSSNSFLQSLASSSAPAPVCSQEQVESLPKVEIESFAVGTTGLLKEVSPLQYQTLPHYEQAVAFRPHILVFEFGTNDANIRKKYPGDERFMQVYTDFLNSFEDARHVVMITPPPIVPNCKRPMFCTSVNGTLLQRSVVPNLRRIASKAFAQRSGKLNPAKEIQLVDANQFLTWGLQFNTLETTRYYYQRDGMHLSNSGSVWLVELVHGSVCNRTL